MDSFVKTFVIRMEAKERTAGRCQLDGFWLCPRTYVGSQSGRRVQRGAIPFWWEIKIRSDFFAERSLALTCPLFVDIQRRGCADRACHGRGMNNDKSPIESRSE